MGPTGAKQGATPDNTTWPDLDSHGRSTLALLLDGLMWPRLPEPLLTSRVIDALPRARHRCGYRSPGGALRPGTGSHQAVRPRWRLIPHVRDPARQPLQDH